MTARERAGWGYLVAWEFRPKRGAENRFEAAYGPSGVWANFFAMGEGFIGTELNRDLNNPRRYWTLDLWVSKAAHDRFRSDHRQEYEAIDAQCQELTEQETELGQFERV